MLSHRLEGWQSGSTHRSWAGLPVTDVADVTGHPEMMEGRVKTLHPAMHAGLLARRDRDDDKAALAGLELAGCTLASDAFFPFRDGVDAAAEAGVKAIVQPGGSVRDEEVIATADERGVAMVFTGRRLFRH